MTKAEILRRIKCVKYWRHRIEVAPGILTPGKVGLELFESFDLPQDLHGKSVLDVGAWDGLCSFEAERRGAASILATDVWRDAPENADYWNLVRQGSLGFLTAHEILGSRVEWMNLSVYDICPETTGVFDLVIFAGVLYHLQHPFLALQRLCGVTREVMVVESHVVHVREVSSTPLAVFYGRSKFADNPSNWWGPTVDCVQEMLLAAGFADTEVTHTNWLRQCEFRAPVRKRVVLRERPEPHSRRLGSVSPGDEVLLVSRRASAIAGRNWRRIKTVAGREAWTGWVPEDALDTVHLVEIPRPGKIRAGRAVIKAYAAPDT